MHGMKNERSIFVYENRSEEKPVPYGDELAINVTEDHNQISVDVLREFARILGLHHVEEDIHYILKTVHNHWEKLALQQGISKSEIHSMRPAFSLADEI